MLEIFLASLESLSKCCSFIPKPSWPLQEPISLQYAESDLSGCLSKNSRSWPNLSSLVLGVRFLSSKTPWRWHYDGFWTQKPRGELNHLRYWWKNENLSTMGNCFCSSQLFFEASFHYFTTLQVVEINICHLGGSISAFTSDCRSQLNKWPHFRSERPDDHSSSWICSTHLDVPTIYYLPGTSK